jgi:DNA-binding transcriptional MocR family regulator
MNSFDNAVRLHVYSHFVDRERPPTARETAEALSCSVADVEAAYRRLADAHVLVLAPGTVEIWMAMPFSAVPTTFRVTVGEHSWWANCAWDALGIPPMLSSDGQISTSCADCLEPVSLTIRDGSLLETSGLIHFAVPARRWWTDIGFT